MSDMKSTNGITHNEKSKGLYHPDEFRDNCGFGLIAHMQGEPSHKLVATAIESLTSMTHRGGINADGKTGDGCGLLLKKPDAFMRAAAKQAFAVDLDATYAVGMVFLDLDDAKADHARETLNNAIQAQGLSVAGWRVVPTDTAVLGEVAIRSLPKFEQIIVNAGDMDSTEADRKLFFARRLAEKALHDDRSFFVTSLSTQVVIYKGLMMPADIDKFFLDLADETFTSSIAVYHQRFSTNTSPKWPLAQPFRYLAHNGEINTIEGNRNWSVARTAKFNSPVLPDIHAISPLVNRTGSDSSSMDNMLEVLLMGDMDMFRAMRMMIPPAWQNMETMDADLRAFYEYNSMHMEPWDGPAGLVMTDGRYAVCMLDRNGLRPSRWVITKDGFFTSASETGTYRYNAEDVVAKGRVGPGQILAIDTETGTILNSEDIDNSLKSKQPYLQWLKDNAIRIETLSSDKATFEQPALSIDELLMHQKMYNVSFEERDQVLRAMAEKGQEPIASMGDDTPMAVLSERARPVYDYFRQKFAQVTNPPIDPLREAVVMSLETSIGAELNVFEETPKHAHRIILPSPVLSHRKYEGLVNADRKDARFANELIRLMYKPAEENLQQAIERITQQAADAVQANKIILVLDDQGITEDELPIHAALATGAIHHSLVQKGLRSDANIIVSTASARDSHHFAVLIGFGATAVYPYLAYQVLSDMVERGEVLTEEFKAHKNFRKSINKGLLKIMSKMGISAITSYRGAQLFEAIGLSEDVADLCFNGVTCRIQGAQFSDLENDQKRLAKDAWKARKPVDQGGILKYIHGKEYHAYNPDVVAELQNAVQNDDYSAWKKYAQLVNERPVATIRDMLNLKETQAISIDEVEPVEKILARFDSAGMSLGALSPEAHESLAEGMNSLGGRSNSGEGGEDPRRYGTNKVSKIKQVASGRFGVTPAYLRSAEVLQIKVAQGAKPGEGGQLPGGKVNELIASLRYSVPGVTLISPPPHHDIYSIEDLAQLIFDLKQVNPNALVSVKLVSEPGVGTIAAGVAKAYADLITIAGYDGGTAASPITSIRYAGSPWELGISEAQQALRSNDLRGKIRMQADGGLKTGLDVIKAAMLGAESFGFGTGPMVAMGCKYLRICHLNNCATGIATQQQHLRDNHYIGTVQMVRNYFTFMAMETREWLAELGMRSLDELIGKTDLFEMREGATTKQSNLDLSPLLANKYVADDKPQFCQQTQNDPFDKGEKAEQMVADMLPAIQAQSGGTFAYDVVNSDRSIGARISGEIAALHGNTAMESQPLIVNLTGAVGQSFGVFNAGGLHMYLKGDANDYVGKGMAGGKLVINPADGSGFVAKDAPIIGNTCLYGATGGRLFIEGRAGERFAVRNSGAHAVIEGAGDHCCEYMTGGCVTVLGSTGHNFGAGMTGGLAFVLDEANNFFDKINPELIEINRINSESEEAERSLLRTIITEHIAETKSIWGQHILDNFDTMSRKFWLVKPKAASLNALLEKVTVAQA